MKTKIELEQNILTITSTIYNKFPELTKYITEMPEQIKVGDEINIKNLQDYYDSLQNIVNKYAQAHLQAADSTETNVFPDYPHYRPEDDIYRRNIQESEINPENISKTKTLNIEPGSMNEKDFADDMSGDDLDVPGSELDDQQESVGSEDEENNYYSLGGDNHNDLEER